MTFRFKAVAVVLAALAGLLLVSVASAGSNGQGKGKPSHDEIVDYWTAERIEGAKPRDISRGPGADQKGPSKKPDKPGGGGGKPGGGGDSAVGGETWNGGGLVQTTTGKILFTMGENDYVCSGSVVDDGQTVEGESIVLTAGHCVYDEVELFATNFLFMPDFDASTNGNTRDCAATLYGCWTATSLVTTLAWSNGDFDDDYGFAVMTDGGTKYSSLEDTVGAQEIAFNQGHPMNVHAFGYPHASPYDGTVLTYCSGTDVSDPYGATTFGLKCDMTGGSSGGPWFMGFDEDTGVGQITSLNSYKYSRGKYSSYMFGPYFDEYTRATFEAAKGATGDLLIGAP